MKKSFEDQFKYFDELLSKQNNIKLKKELDQFKNLNKLQGDKKVCVSLLYEKINEYNSSFKLLGRELTYLELKNSSLEEIKQQVTLAYLNNAIGAKYIAERIIKKLERLSVDENLDIEAKIIFWGNLKCSYYYSRGEYSQSVFIAKDFLNKFSYKTVYEKIIQRDLFLKLTKSLIGINQYSEALKNLEKYPQQTDPNNKSLKLYLYRAEIYLNQNEIQKAQKSLEAISEIMAKNKINEYFEYLLLQAILNHQIKNFTNAKDILLSATNHNNFKNLSPVKKISFLFWVHENPLMKLDFYEKIFLFTCPIFNPYSYILGKNYPVNNKVKLRTFFNTIYKENSNDIWLIRNKDITPCCYQDVISEYNCSDLKILDLKSGIHLNLIKEGSFETLMPLQSNLLSYLISHSFEGVNKWSLSDFLYRQEFINIEDGENRLKTLLKSLKELPINISRFKNNFKINLPENLVVILPMNYLKEGEHIFFKSLKNSFTRLELELHFKIKSTTAKRWITYWLNLNVIKKIGKGKNTRYEFI